MPEGQFELAGEPIDIVDAILIDETGARALALTPDGDETVIRIPEQGARSLPMLGYVSCGRIYEDFNYRDRVGLDRTHAEPLEEAASVVKDTDNGRDNADELDDALDALRDALDEDGGRDA